MGKGDQRSRRGKTWIGTYGKKRPRKAKKVSLAKKAVAKPARKASKKSD
jgi:ribosomal small subunit protein bTHX